MTSDRNEQQLDSLLAGLPREITPQRDVWQSISARITQAEPAERERFSRRPAVLALAASVVLVATVALLWRPGSAPVNEIAPPARQLTLDQVPVNTWLRASEREYMAAFREFMVLAPLDPLTSEAASGVRDGWLATREVEQQLDAALLENPADEFLAEQMALLRARQLDLLRQVVAVDRASRRETI